MITLIRSIDICRFRHNYKDFYQNFVYRISINMERATTSQSAHTSLLRILSFIIFLFWWRSLKRSSNFLVIVWISLETKHLNNFKSSFKWTLYVFSYILADRIIGSQCISVMNIWFNIFRCIWCFDQKFRNLINLKPQHELQTLRNRR